MNSKPTRPGVLLVGHGTRDPLGTQEFMDLSELLKKQCHRIPVEPAFLEFQQPTISSAWQKLADQACDHIHVAPLLLFAAGHANRDIPDQVAACAGKFCGITHDQSRPLSRHPSIIQWIVERLAQTISHHRVDPRRTAVVMVGRGSYSPCAQADMRILSELVRHRMAMSHMHTAFYAMAEPRLPDVLNQVAENSELETVIVHPHLLFHGQLFESISHQTTEASERFPALRWLLSGDLRPNKGVANAVHFRVFGRGNLVSAAKNAGFSNIAADETRPGAIKLDSARITGQ